MRQQQQQTTLRRLGVTPTVPDLFSLSEGTNLESSRDESAANVSRTERFATEISSQLVHNKSGLARGRHNWHCHFATRLCGQKKRYIYIVMNSRETTVRRASVTILRLAAAEIIKRVSQHSEQSK